MAAVHPLWSCFRDANLYKVRNYYSLHPELVNVKDRYGYYPLHYAARYGTDPDAVGWILRTYPEAAFKKTTNGHLPFELAVILNDSRNHKVLKIIYEANPDAATVLTEGDATHLHMLMAFKPKDPTKIKMVMNYYPQAPRMRDKLGRFPLHYAAVSCCKSAKATEWLIQAYPQAAVEKDKYGDIPLALELQAPDHEIYDMLLKAVIRHLKAGVIQRAWKECRYNPDYMMCERVMSHNITYNNIIPI